MERNVLIEFTHEPFNGQLAGKRANAYWVDKSSRTGLTVAYVNRATLIHLGVNVAKDADILAFYEGEYKIVDRRRDDFPVPYGVE